jgi:hypothetical protein
MRLRPLAAAALLVPALIASERADAQSTVTNIVNRLQPAVSVVGSAIDHRVKANTDFERTTGPLFGVQVDAVPLEGMVLSLRALGGALRPAHGSAADARDLGEVAAVMRMRLLPWLDGRGGLVSRTFSSSLARQRWTTAQIGAEVRIPMLDGRIEGTAGGLLLPIVRVSGHSSPDLAIGTSMGIRHVSRRYILALNYQLERYDFPEVSGTRRVEEHSTLSIRAGYRFGRVKAAPLD